MTVNRSSSTRTVRPIPYLLWPRVRGRWFTGDLRQPDPHPRGHGRDEAVHLAVEPDPPHDVGAHGLQRAAVVVQAHAGRPRDQPVREPGGDPLRQRVLPALPPAADHVEVASLEPVHERAGCRPGRSAGRRPRSRRRRRGRGRSPPRTPRSGRSCGAGGPPARGRRSARAARSFSRVPSVLPSSTRTSS